MNDRTENTYVCPHCLTRYDYSQIWFKCGMPDEDSKETHRALNEEIMALKEGKKRDKVLGKYAKDMPYEKVRLSEDERKSMIREDLTNGYFKCSKKLAKDYNGKTVPQVSKCYVCGNTRVTKHVCPNPRCHKVIEIDTNEKQFIISLAGSKSSGKTTFLGALFHAIKTKLRNMTSQWTIQFNEEARNLLANYQSKMTGEGDIEGTIVAQTKPCIVTFNQGIGKKYSFIFYDVPGEVFEMSDEDSLDVTRIHSYAGQFTYPDYIILLTDPVNIRSIRDLIKDSDSAPEALKDEYENATKKDVPPPEMFVHKIRQMIADIIIQYGNEEESRNAREDKPLDVPVALCISKKDNLGIIFDEGESDNLFLKDSCLSAERVAERIYSRFKGNLIDRSESLKRKLKDLEETPLVNAIDINFTRNVFLAFSAYGSAGIVSSVDDIAPGNVLDPFVWIMSQVDEGLFDSESTDDFDGDF